MADFLTEQQQLYGAIVADPLDDAPRLIYADWLDEQGQEERALFIRLQIEVANFEKAYPTKMG